MVSHELTLNSRSRQLYWAVKEDLLALMSCVYHIRQMCWFIGRFLLHYKLLLCDYGFRPWFNYVFIRIAFCSQKSNCIYSARAPFECNLSLKFLCSLQNLREKAEFCLGQNFHRLGWGASSIFFQALAASLPSTHGIQGHEHNQIYSIVFMNEILTPMSKFVLCWFRAPTSIANALTHVHSCLRSFLIAWEGFSTKNIQHTEATFLRTSLW
jgi:hypothetical protein